MESHKHKHKHEHEHKHKHEHQHVVILCGQARHASKTRVVALSPWGGIQRCLLGLHYEAGSCSTKSTGRCTSIQRRQHNLEGKQSASKLRKQSEVYSKQELPIPQHFPYNLMSSSVIQIKQLVTLSKRSSLPECSELREVPHATEVHKSLQDDSLTACLKIDKMSKPPRWPKSRRLPSISPSQLGTRGHAEDSSRVSPRMPKLSRKLRNLIEIMGSNRAPANPAEKMSKASVGLNVQSERQVFSALVESHPVVPSLPILPPVSSRAPEPVLEIGRPPEKPVCIKVLVRSRSGIRRFLQT